MKTRIIKLVTLFTLIFTLHLPVAEVQAQCPMCRMSAESNLKNGGVDGRGLNRGILFMLAMPYLIVGGIAYVWWRNRKEEEDEELV